jgi:hypothetical protein
VSRRCHGDLAGASTLKALDARNIVETGKFLFAAVAQALCTTILNDRNYFTMFSDQRGLATNGSGLKPTER